MEKQNNYKQIDLFSYKLKAKVVIFINISYFPLFLTTRNICTCGKNHSNCDIKYQIVNALNGNSIHLQGIVAKLKNND